jgi:tRNA (guanine37-N1)-methyltransferase
MIYSIITTQPGIYDSFLTTGLIGRGIAKKVIDIEIYNLHDYALDVHRSIDDSPYGGGPGMVLKVDVMARAIASLKSKVKSKKLKVILLTPQGKRFDQSDAKRLAKLDHLILIAGRFEGYDERIRSLVDEEISLGDFVLTSGDLPAQVLINATSRQIPGFIEKNESIQEESFENNLLEYPQYTRPEVFKGKSIPEILLSGNHAAIAKWRHEEASKKTREKRPDLLD